MTFATLQKPQANAEQYIAALVLDLKLQLMGRQPRSPITWERLEQWRLVHGPEITKANRSRT